jgi:4-amino-4-deoxy-L-arabinose transferase-like glycosyltransferase
MGEVDNRPILSDTIWIGFLCLAMNSLLAVFIGLHQPTYFRDSHADWNPDGNNDVRLGENIWSRHVYSRQAGPPYQPDIKWTPIYPLLAGGICLFFKAIWPLYALQVAFSIATALLLYGMTTWMFGRWIGLIAGLIYGSDLMVAILNFAVLTESLFVLLSTISIFLWIRIRMRKGFERVPLLDYILIGVVMGLAILTRPTALYLPLVLACAELVLFFKGQRRLLILSPVLVLCAYLVISPWIARNYINFRVPRLTIVDTLNLVYYVGAGVYQTEFGIGSIEEAQARISSDYNLVLVTQAHNPWLADEDITTMQDKWRKAAWDIFTTYPLSLLQSAVTGVIVGWMAHNAMDVAHAAGTEWSNPGLSNLRGLQFSKFFHGLFRNHPFLISVFIWEELMIIATLILVPVGIVIGVGEIGRRRTCVVLLMIAAYYLCTMAMQGLIPDARLRAPVLPLVYIFSAIGSVRTWQYFVDLRRKHGMVRAVSAQQS